MGSALYDNLVQAMGGFPDRQLKDALLLETVECDLYRREKHLLVCADRTIPLYLLLPRTDERRPGILAHHQHAGEYQLGKSEPAGIKGNPEMFYAQRLAEHGYVTVAWDCVGFEERHNPLLGQRHEHYLATKYLALGACLEREYMLDTMYVTDFLLSRSEVDPNRLGCIGHSLGGQNVLFNMLLDARVTVGVSSCGIATLQSFIEENITHNLAWFVPGIVSLGDTPGLAPLLRGKSLFMSQGRQDPIFPLRGVRDFAAAAAVHAKVVTHEFDGGHQFPAESLDLAISFFDEWLRSTAK